MKYNKALLCLGVLVSASLSFAGNGIDLNLNGSASDSSVDFGAAFSGTTADLSQGLGSSNGDAFAGNIASSAGTSNVSGSNGPLLAPPTPAPEPVTVLLGVGAIATAIARRRR